MLGKKKKEDVKPEVPAFNPVIPDTGLRCAVCNEPVAIQLGQNQVCAKHIRTN